jgi:hypothetical protein
MNRTQLVNGFFQVTGCVKDLLDSLGRREFPSQLAAWIMPVEWAVVRSHIVSGEFLSCESAFTVEPLRQFWRRGSVDQVKTSVKVQFFGIGDKQRVEERASAVC